MQKTNVEKVLPVYGNFIKKYPSVETLADADPHELKESIRPLGLLYRAERMKKMAESVVSDYGGIFPKERKSLRGLYGVGDYVTNAVRAFAYEEQVPIVETNIIRIFDRVFDVRSDRPRARTDKLLWNLVGTALPKMRSRDYNLALLDFAALVCTARNPRCPNCPMRNFCNYYQKLRPTVSK